MGSLQPCLAGELFLDVPWGHLGIQPHTSQNQQNSSRVWSSRLSSLLQTFAQRQSRGPPGARVVEPHSPAWMPAPWLAKCAAPGRWLASPEHHFAPLAMAPSFRNESHCTGALWPRDEGAHGSVSAGPDARSTRWCWRLCPDPAMSLGIVNPPRSHKNSALVLFAFWWERQGLNNRANWKPQLQDRWLGGGWRRSWSLSGPVCRALHVTGPALGPGGRAAANDQARKGSRVPGRRNSPSLPCLPSFVFSML